MASIDNKKTVQPLLRPKDTWQLVKRLWPYMRPYKRVLVPLVLLMIIGIPIPIIQPLLVKHVVDSVVTDINLTQLAPIGALLIALSFVSQLLRCWQELLNRHQAAHAIELLRGGRTVLLADHVGTGVGRAYE